MNIKITGRSSDADGSFFANRTLKKVFIYQKFRWIDYLNAWMMPGSDDPDVDRSTVALELSATLLHELVHLMAEYSEADGDTQNNCEYSYLIENMYRWAMYKRYPEAIANCSPLAPTLDGSSPKTINSLWGQDTSVWLAVNPSHTPPCPGDDVVPFDWISSFTLAQIMAKM